MGTTGVTNQSGTTKTPSRTGAAAGLGDCRDYCAPHHETAILASRSKKHDSIRSSLSFFKPNNGGWKVTLADKNFDQIFSQRETK
jgi:hypothetical protein